MGFAGDLHVAQKEETKAREAYEEAVKLAREMYLQDPISEPTRNTLNILLIRLAGFEKTRNPEKSEKLYQEALQVARTMVKSDPQGQTHQLALALSLAPTGARVEASQIAQTLLAGQKTLDAELLVDMARVYAQCSDTAGLAVNETSAYKNRALQCLTQAADQGYRDFFYLTFHPDFAPIQKEHRFKDLILNLQSTK